MILITSIIWLEDLFENNYEIRRWKSNKNKLFTSNKNNKKIVQDKTLLIFIASSIYFIWQFWCLWLYNNWNLEVI
jgi:hypothetical protein